MTLRQTGALLLVLLTACANTGRLTPHGSSLEYTPGTRFLAMEVIEPGVGTAPVSVEGQAFQRAVQRMARDLWLGAPPREAARALLDVELELEGEWLAEVSRGQVLTLVPWDGKETLTPVEERALRDDYVRWCSSQGGGDCLGLLEDGPYLRTDDRRTLALALAFGSVLEESREALIREVLNPQMVIATVVWTVGMYLSMWLLPEPTTKVLAATLTVVLVGWLGVDTLWGLVDGWAQLVQQAHEARTFGQLRTAGARYAKVLGTDAARALIMAVSALTGRTLGEIAARVRSLPGYGMAVVQAEAQGLRLAVALESAESVVVSSEGALAVVMLSHNGASGASVANQGSSTVTTVIRHRGGNQQVRLGNGQRWHLPRGKSPKDIPAADPLGDELQAAASQLAKKWGPNKLSAEEKRAIDEAFGQGKFFQAARLEGQARGRWVEKELQKQFSHLEWNRRGVDVTGPAGRGFHYEVLAGTDDNFGRHGRRMFDIFFRMIFF